MDSTTASQPFAPLFDPVPSRLPGGAPLSASIWAPQPLPSENTWSRAIDSINRVNEDLRIDPSFRRAPSHLANQFNEDVFGPVGFMGNNRRAVGAIGDGRKRASPDQEAIVSARSSAYMRI